MWGLDRKKEGDGKTGSIDYCKIWKLLRRYKQINGCTKKTYGISKI
jgi:hypothetical protein